VGGVCMPSLPPSVIHVFRVKCRNTPKGYSVAYASILAVG